MFPIISCSTEVLEAIAEWLTIPDIVKLRQVCKFLFEARLQDRVSLKCAIRFMQEFHTKTLNPHDDMYTSRERYFYETNLKTKHHPWGDPCQLHPRFIAAFFAVHPAPSWNDIHIVICNPTCSHNVEVQAYLRSFSSPDQSWGDLSAHKEFVPIPCDNHRALLRTAFEVLQSEGLAAEIAAKYYPHAILPIVTSLNSPDLLHHFLQAYSYALSTTTLGAMEAQAKFAMGVSTSLSLAVKAALDIRIVTMLAEDTNFRVNLPQKLKYIYTRSTRYAMLHAPNMDVVDVLIRLGQPCQFEGNKPLGRACDRGDIALIRGLLLHPEVFDAFEREGLRASPQQYIHDDLVKVLIDPTNMAAIGNNALVEWAILKGRGDVASLLLEGRLLSMALVEADNKKFEEWVAHACRKGYNATVDVLLSQAAIRKLNLDISNAVMEACAILDTTLILKLLRHSPSVELTNLQFIANLALNRSDEVLFSTVYSRGSLSNLSNASALLANACKIKNFSIAKIIIDSLHQVSKDIATDAFITACESGASTIAEYLLTHHDVDPTTQSNKIIRQSAQKGSLEIMKLLLNDGRADPASNSNEPLSLACLNNNLPAVRLLLTDPRVTPTPRALLNAITANNPFIVQELLDTGKIDPSHSDNAPFRAACRLAILPVIKLLCADTRVDPSARECEGLVDAVAANRVDVVKFLMTVESIDVMTRNLYCLKECFEKCYWDMARVLISHHSMDLGSVVEMYHWPNFHMLESLLE